MVTGTIGRRIRLGLIGGGPGSIIGETHRIAARLDGQYDIVAAALSSNPERARQAALELGIDGERAYASWQQMLEAEAVRTDRIDAVAVMTPNDSHHAICMLALDLGVFHRHQEGIAGQQFRDARAQVAPVGGCQRHQGIQRFGGAGVARLGR